MSDTAEIASLIRGLAEPLGPKRQAAALELFRRGQDLARPAAERWLANHELASCFVLSESSFPETTVGVAVDPETFERIRTANGSPRLADVPPDQDAEEFELDFPHGVRLDVLTTQQPEGAGAIAKYLQKFGEGIQQVELLVRHVDRATEILRTRFLLEPVYPATRGGADGTRVNFFLAATPLGKKVLIELVEMRAAGARDLNA